MEINNIYQNQYKTDVKMSESFNAFWARNGVESKNDVVKVLIYSVFDLLNSDLAKSVSDANANQTVLDRTEFRDLMEVMTKIIGKYINTDTKNPFIDQNTTTTRLRELIVEEVVKCISQVGDELKEKSKDRSDFTQKLRKILDEFFKSNRREDLVKTTDNSKTIAQFKEEFKSTDVPEKNQQQVSKEIQQSSIFKKFMNRFVGNSNKLNNSESNIKTLSKIGLFEKIKKKKERKDKSTAGKDTKLIQNITKPFKKIQTKLKKLSEKMTKSYKFLRGAFSSILKPVKNKLTSIWEGIVHPMKTLETFFHKHKWLSNIAKVMMSNPATMYMVGFMVGKLWNVIRTPMFRYIINPMLELTKWVAQKFVIPDNMEDEQSFKHIKDKIEKLSQLTKRNGISSNGFLPDMLINISKSVGGDYEGLKKTLGYLFGSGAWILNGMLNIAKNGMFSYYRGAGFIQKILLLSAYQQGNLLSEIVGVKEGEDKTEDFTMTDAIKSEKNVMNNIDDAFIKKDENGKPTIVKEGIEKINRAREMWHALLNELNTNQRISSIRNILEKQGQIVSMKEIKDILAVTENGIFTGTQIEQEFNKIVKELINERYDSTPVIKNIINQSIAGGELPFDALILDPENCIEMQMEAIDRYIKSRMKHTDSYFEIFKDEPKTIEYLLSQISDSKTFQNLGFWMDESDYEKFKNLEDAWVKLREKKQNISDAFARSAGQAGGMALAGGLPNLNEGYQSAKTEVMDKVTDIIPNGFDETDTNHQEINEILKNDNLPTVPFVRVMSMSQHLTNNEQNKPNQTITAPITIPSTDNTPQVEVTNEVKDEVIRNMKSDNNEREDIVSLMRSNEIKNDESIELMTAATIALTTTSERIAILKPSNLKKDSVMGGLDDYGGHRYYG